MKKQKKKIRKLKDGQSIVFIFLSFFFIFQP